MAAARLVVERRRAREDEEQAGDEDGRVARARRLGKHLRKVAQREEHREEEEDARQHGHARGDEAENEREACDSQLLARKARRRKEAIQLARVRAEAALARQLQAGGVKPREEADVGTEKARDLHGEGEAVELLEEADRIARELLHDPRRRILEDLHGRSRASARKKQVSPAAASEGEMCMHAGKLSLGPTLQVVRSARSSG
jgi:hypothetical protein